MTVSEKKWNRKDHLSQISNKANLPKWFLNILATRGITKESEIDDFLHPKYEDLLDPYLFTDMKKAVSLFMKHIKGEGRIVIYGDYDVDGVTATALLFKVFKKIAPQKAFTYIPKREEEGYGLNLEALSTLKKEGASLLVAVDCGIGSGEIIGNKELLGLDFIICDHHKIEEKKLPQKTPILHPELSSDDKTKNLSGCGVAFFFAKAIMSKLDDYFYEGEEKWLLDLVALSTICDVVPLSGQNRILTKFGLLVLAKTKNLGLKALFGTSSLSESDLSSYSVGFVIGPRINAAGRLEGAEKSLRLLATEDENEAKNLALDLERLNKERQDLCQKIVQEATAKIEKSGLGEKMIIAISDPGWPRGVVGIIASRISEKYSRPTIVFEDDGTHLHGSARSIEGFDITKALSFCSGDLIKFGGHTKAAGLSLLTKNFEKFYKKIEDYAENFLKKEDLIASLSVDTEIEENEINDEALNLLSQLEPVGFGNKTPIFLLSNVFFDSPKKVGKEGDHIKFYLKKSGLSGIYFKNHAEIFEDTPYDVLFTLRYNEWNNRKSIELRVLDLRSSEKGVYDERHS